MCFINLNNTCVIAAIVWAGSNEHTDKNNQWIDAFPTSKRQSSHIQTSVTIIQTSWRVHILTLKAYWKKKYDPNLFRWSLIKWYCDVGIYTTKGRDRFHWAATPLKPYKVGKRQFLWTYPHPETVVVPCFNAFAHAQSTYDRRHCAL